ncbi:hypothetical protein LUZ60_004525 [Juncus effusus]|nr:hypothetical protein LUZ60_004525 [Juncus effusus]
MKVKSINNLIPPADVQIVTSDGQSISAHSSVLSSSSPVLERMIDRARKGWNSDSVIRILGVPSDAVIAFIQILYSSRLMSASAILEMDDIMDEHCLQLLAMAHKYRVTWLKRDCEAAIAVRLTPDKAVDVLKLAKLCDAPRLYQRCVQIVAKDFRAVQESDGWRFVKRHDSALELEILQFLQDSDQRKKRWRQHKAAQNAYNQLSEAMDWLSHIFHESCSDTKEPCTKYQDCLGLKQLMNHLATCRKKLAPAGCLHCKRTWQLFRLHSSICNNISQNCMVPFCSHFKMKTQNEKQDKTWKLLVKKVVTAKLMLSLGGRKRPETVVKSCAKYTAVRN